jgi:hypothetical protein
VSFQHHDECVHVADGALIDADGALIAPFFDEMQANCLQACPGQQWLSEKHHLEGEHCAVLELATADWESAALRS